MQYLSRTYSAASNRHFFSGNPVFFREYCLTPDAVHLYVHLAPYPEDSLTPSGSDSGTPIASLMLTVYPGAQNSQGLYPLEVQLDDLLRGYDLPLSIRSSSRDLQGGMRVAISNSSTFNFDTVSYQDAIAYYYPGKIPNRSFAALDTDGTAIPILMMQTGEWDSDLLLARKPQGHTLTLTMKELQAMEGLYMVANDKPVTIEAPHIGEAITGKLRDEILAGFLTSDIYRLEEDTDEQMLDIEGTPTTRQLKIVYDLFDDPLLLRWQNRFGQTEALALPCTASRITRLPQLGEPTQYTSVENGIKVRRHLSVSLREAYTLSDIPVSSSLRDCLTDMLQSCRQQICLEGQWHECSITADLSFRFRPQSADRCTLQVELAIED